MIKVSIIIPVYNDLEDLSKVLRALNNQTIDCDSYEIIVVDNGSTEPVKELVNQYSNVTYLLENIHLKSPYSCRNRGIEISKGDVIVLLDSTCIPEPEWLKNGLDCLCKMEADMISSNVLFDFGEKITAGKLYDSNNLRIESAIKNRGAVMTASLFVRREVFNKIGKFPEGVRSGADLRWTHKATKKGFSLKFCKNSVAKKKARTFIESVKKQWRVGKGHPAIWKERGKNINVFKKFISSLIPYHPKKVQRLANDKGVDLNFYLKFKLYFVAYFIWITMSVANIYGQYLMNKEKNN